MSLRLRLLSGLAALVIAALAALAVGTTVAVRHNLISRLDSQLTTASASLGASRAPASLGASRAPGIDASSSGTGGEVGGGPGGGVGGGPGGGVGGGPGGGVGGGPGRGGPPVSGRSGSPVSGWGGAGRGGVDAPTAGTTAQVRAVAGPDDYVEYLGDRGSVLSAVHPTVAGGADRPVIDSAVGWPAAETGRSDALGTRVFSTRGSTGGAERVAVTTLPDGTGVLVAGPLRTVDATIRHLIEAEAGIGAAVLLVTLGLGLVLARHLTRPLEQIARTADAIAGGDLERRVPIGPGRSEVARVGTALNGMLASIAAAFARRDSTEARLRQFVADASHELATPLTSIRGYAELFGRGLAERPEDLRVAMSRIEAEARRMGGLVDELLLLARLDAAQAPTTPEAPSTPAAPSASATPPAPAATVAPARAARGGEPTSGSAPSSTMRTVDLAVVAADTASDLRAADPDRPVRLVAPGPVPVAGDEDRLRQVAANLTSNARRHTPPGTPVTVAARVEAGRAVLQVSDSGPGMAPADAARVFERFYRIDPARSRAVGGSGLGLAIVAAIAAAHGGVASVTSTPGSGATFTVTLPLAPS